MASTSFWDPAEGNVGLGKDGEAFMGLIPNLQNLMANAGLELVPFCLKSVAKQLQISVSIPSFWGALGLGWFCFFLPEPILQAVCLVVSRRVQEPINWNLGRLKMC